MDKSNFYWVSAMESQRDPIRTTHWRLRFNIPAIKSAMGAAAASLLADLSSDVDISVMTKTATVPKIAINTAQSYFMGQSIDFATNTEFDKTSSFEIQETSDLIALKFLGLWHNYVHNSDSLAIDKVDTAALDPNNEVGYNLGAGKYNTTAFPKSAVRNNNWVYLELYDYTQGVVLFRVNYINCWPKEIGGASLSHEGPNLMKYTVVFNHDRYKFVVPSKFGSMGKGYDS